MKGRDHETAGLLGTTRRRSESDEQRGRQLDLASTTSAPQVAQHAALDQRATASTDRPFAPLVGRTGEHQSASFFRRRTALRQRLLDQLAAAAGYIYRDAPAGVAAACDALLAALLTVAAVEHQRATSTSVATLNDSTSRSLPAVADQARSRAAHWCWSLGIAHVQLDPASVREWLLIHETDQRTPAGRDGQHPRPAVAPLRAV